MSTTGSQPGMQLDAVQAPHDDTAHTVIDDYLDALLADGVAQAEAPPVQIAPPTPVAMPRAAPPEPDDMVIAPTMSAVVSAPVPAPAPTMPAIESAAAPTPAVAAFAPTTAVAACAPTPASAYAAPVAVAPPAPLPSARLIESPAARSLAASPATQRWLRVAVGDASYAVELLCVQEVVRMAPIVAMRGAQRAVLGVMNLRGRIVPVFDLGLWLDSGCVHADERSRIVVVERNDELIGVLVTAVEDVVWLAADRIEPPLPGTLPGAIVGVARVGASPTVLLDANALFG